MVSRSELYARTGSRQTTPTPSGSGESIYIDVTAAPYNATGNGSTDDTAAIQAAINAAAATGGKKTIWFPAPASGDFYKCDGQLNVMATDALTLLGDGARVEPTQDRIPTSLVYTGTSSAFILAGKSRGLTIKGLGIHTNNTSFTGDLITLNSDGLDRVAYSTLLEDCCIGGRTSAARNSRSGMHMAGAVEAYINRCNFGWLDYGVIGVTPGDLGYANDIHISNCRFTIYNDTAIHASGFVQASIRYCVFEPAFDGVSGRAIECKNVIGGGTDGSATQLLVMGNGFWDAEEGTWIKFRGFGLTVLSNFFEVRSAMTAVLLDGGLTGASISGNVIRGLTGSKFLDAADTYFHSVNDDGSNILDGAVTYNANAGAIRSGRLGASILTLQEQETPPTAVADSVILYAQDNGAGKTQLMALFPTGAAKQLEIET